MFSLSKENKLLKTGLSNKESNSNADSPTDLNNPASGRAASIEMNIEDFGTLRGSDHLTKKSKGSNYTLKNSSSFKQSHE